jgi:two-component system, LuxR family, sensor kinase FixL
LAGRRRLWRCVRTAALLGPVLLLVIGQCLLVWIWSRGQPFAVIAQGTLAVLSCALMLRCALRWDPVSSTQRAARNSAYLGFNAARCGILIADHHGRIVLANAAAYAMFGYAADCLPGHPLSRLLPVIPQVGFGGAAVQCGQRADGSNFPVNLDLVAAPDTALATTVAIVEELPEQRYDKESDEFIAIASHDLRAPMRAILSLAQWIVADDHGVDAKTAERLQLIQDRIQRIGRLLDAVQRYVRLGRPLVPSGPVLTAAELGEHIAATVQGATDAKIHLDVTMTSVLVMQLPLDEVLRHLIDNAIKHHDLRHGNITLAASDAGNHWRFTVTDDGPGIPEQYRRTIFDLFKSLKPRDEVEGSGLGLAIVHRIVHQLGGECGVDPVVGRGSQFWFDWPKLAPAVSATGRAVVSDA